MTFIASLFLLGLLIVGTANADGVCSESNNTTNNDDHRHQSYYQLTHKFKNRNVGFMQAPTKPGEIQHVQYADGTVVDPYAVQIGLPPELAKTMREYVKETGILDLYKEIYFSKMKYGELAPGTNRVFTLDDVEWYLQRPESKWKSNMHWLNGNTEDAHNKYLSLLGQGGFDIVLDAIGNFFDLDGIDIYSTGFMGVTHCEKGFLHNDFSGADGKAFNVIIPLELVEDSTDPEFLLTERSEDGDGETLGVHYEYDVALAVGDDTFHGTGECDYRDDYPGQMRMVMSVYMADINENNVDAIIGDYTDPFPPADPQYLMKHRGRHWRKDGSAQLPKIYDDSIEEETTYDVEEDDDDQQQLTLSKFSLDMKIDQLAMMVNAMMTNGEITEEKVIDRLRQSIHWFEK